MAGHAVKLMGLYKQGKYDDVVNLYGQLPKEIKDSVRVKITAAQALVKMSKKDEGTRLLKEINIDSLKDVGLLSEIAACYLEVGDIEMARKMSILGINLDDTIVDNYIVLYKSYFDKDKSQAAIWTTKYILAGIMGTKESQKEQKQQIEEAKLRINDAQQRPSMVVWKYIDAVKNGKYEGIWQVLSAELKHKFGSAQRIDMSTLGEANAYVNFMVTREDITGTDATVEISGDFTEEGGNLEKNVHSTFKLILDNVNWYINDADYLRKMQPLPPMNMPETNTLPQEGNQDNLNQYSMKDLEDKFLRTGLVDSYWETDWAIKQGEGIVPYLEKLLDTYIGKYQGSSDFPSNVVYTLVQIGGNQAEKVLNKYNFIDAVNALKIKRNNPNIRILRYDNPVYEQASSNSGKIATLKKGEGVFVLKKNIVNQNERDGRGGQATFDYIEVPDKNLRAYIKQYNTSYPLYY